MLSCVFLCGRRLPRFTAASVQQQLCYPRPDWSYDLGGPYRYHVSDQESCWNWNDWSREQIGTPQEVHNNPVNKFVAGFHRCPAMNFIPVKLEGMGLSQKDCAWLCQKELLQVLREKGYEGKGANLRYSSGRYQCGSCFLGNFPEFGACQDFCFRITGSRVSSLLPSGF